MRCPAQMRGSRRPRPVEFAERAPVRRQVREQRRGRHVRRVWVEHVEPVQDFARPTVCVEERAAAPRRTTVAIDVDDVDVRRPERDAASSARAPSLTSAKIDCALTNLVVGDLAPAAIPASVAVESISASTSGSEIGMRRSSRSGTSPCPSSARAGPSRRACATIGARTGSRKCRAPAARARRRRDRAMSSTANIPIAMPKRSARDPPARVSRLPRRELRLVHVGEHQPVADEPGSVAHDDADLADVLGEGERRGQHLDRSSRRARSRAAASPAPG